METQRCKGSKDLLHEDMARFRHVEKAFRSCCLQWGYKEIRTPTLEYLHLFTSTGTLTPNMLSRVYSFLDWDGWSGERVVLRPDSTIPAARLYIENLLQDNLAKLFYVEDIFSFEETGKESRERWQCGAEMMGSANPSADVELILLALETLAQLGISEVKLYLSHAGLIRALLHEVGLAPSEQSRLFDRIMDGDTTAVLQRLMAEKPELRDTLSLLFELKGDSPGFLQNLRASLLEVFPKLEANIDDFIVITQLLKDLGRNYQIDMASGKGFEYYTGVLFQFRIGEKRLGGGGRYNDLIPLMGGGDIPASGFALDVDQLMSLTRSWEDTTPSILIRNDDNTGKNESLPFEIAGLLRRVGGAADLDQGYTGETKHRWILSIRGSKGKSAFLLTDQLSGKATELDSTSEVLGILQVANASKTSPS
ncbi:MAG: ATP phosphoribosyltransferase regulatory subunit [Chloroflexi bacterium]|nr:ATP phosphoribosyltransferase regulatory subunit [Chloroflexota bacterium]